MNLDTNYGEGDGEGEGYFETESKMEEKGAPHIGSQTNCKVMVHVVC